MLSIKVLKTKNRNKKQETRNKKQETRNKKQEIRNKKKIINNTSRYGTKTRLFIYICLLSSSSLPLRSLFLTVSFIRLCIHDMNLEINDYLVCRHREELACPNLE